MQMGRERKKKKGKRKGVAVMDVVETGCKLEGSDIAMKINSEMFRFIIVLDGWQDS